MGRECAKAIKADAAMREEWQENEAPNHLPHVWPCLQAMMKCLNFILIAMGRHSVALK